MNRRGFLGLLAGVAAGAAFDPDRLLWVPGAKMISIPAVTSEEYVWVVHGHTVGTWEHVNITGDVAAWLRKQGVPLRALRPSYKEFRERDFPGGEIIASCWTET